MHYITCAIVGLEEKEIIKLCFMPQGAYSLIAKTVMFIGSYNKCILEMCHRGESDYLVGQISENVFYDPDRQFITIEQILVKPNSLYSGLRKKQENIINNNNNNNSLRY